MTNQPAMLVLEDGTTFQGENFGARGERAGEVVFNTSMTGYQEVLTDPSYTGQIVVMTYPEIGNYGVNIEDGESHRIHANGFVVREYCSTPSNWRSTTSLGDYMEDRGLVGVSGIDTRKLVRHLRMHGAMRGIVSTLESNPKALLERVKSAPSMTGQALGHRVGCLHRYEWNGNLLSKYSQPHVVVFDFGVKHGILRGLADQGCRITVVPALTSASDVMALQPDGIVLSNGPGDPEPLHFLSRTIRILGERYPLMGICLGHQLLGLAHGAKTYKLKFGHRGCNHPVKNLLTGKVEITSHNHGFSVDADTLPPDFELTYVNLNDGTVEGYRHKYLPMFSVQFHPEASPGRHDARHLFDEFAQVVYSQSRAMAVAS